jgi:hypothetical protein
LADDAARLGDDAARLGEDAARLADEPARAADDTPGGGGHEPPGGGREPPGGGGGPPKPTRPKKDELNKVKGQTHHESLTTLRRALGDALRRLRSGTELRARSPLRRRLEPVLDALPDTTVRERIDEVYKILRDADEIENAIVELWEEATRREMTPREVLLEKVAPPAGDGGREIVANKARISEDGRTTDLLDELEDAEFREVMRQGAPIRDLAFADNLHGAYTHMFQEWLIDRALGEGEGRAFRRWLADLKGPAMKKSATAREREFFVVVWDSLFDEYDSGHINTPEDLGKVLWEHGGFPIDDKSVP